MVEKNQTKHSSDEETKHQDLDAKDLNRFVKMQMATGRLPDDYNVEKISDAQKRDLITDYNKWVEQGRPKPEMPKLAKTAQEKILRVYRRRSFNQEFLTAVVDGKDVQIGVELIPVYAKNYGIEDRTNQIGTDHKYTIPYTEQKARELVERCKKEAKSPKLYIKDESGPTFRIKIEDNFFKPFDEVINAALQRKII
jgi:uncharacterized protein YqkB